MVKVVKSSSENSLMEYKGHAFNQSFITDSDFVASMTLTLASSLLKSLMARLGKLSLTRLSRVKGMLIFHDILTIKCHNPKALKQWPAVVQSSASRDSTDFTLLELEYLRARR
ncbi:hypothetical protein J6590_017768 [Homalodisca vitripennis]|nr:hypothetical protein J6590_017768 [Homalodisca vitripennis]